MNDIVGVAARRRCRPCANCEAEVVGPPSRMKRRLVFCGQTCRLSYQEKVPLLAPRRSNAPLVEHRPCPSFPGYEATRDGKVFSHWRKAHFGCWVNDPEHWNELSPSGERYDRVSVYGDGKKGSATVHRLVADAFYGPQPNGSHIRHLDGNRRNNHASNLKYGTSKENGGDDRRLGTKRGERGGRAILKETDVLSIRQRHYDGESMAAIGRSYGLRYQTIQAVVTRRTWSHLP